MDDTTIMTNKDFYAYVKAQRSDLDSTKSAAAKDVYGFLWECGVSKQGVVQYLKTRIEQIGHDKQLDEATKQAQIAEYYRLEGVFFR